jgi:cardiolipin synthase
VRLEGPVTREIQKLFLDTWARQKGEPLPERRYYPPQREAGNHLVRAIGSVSDDENSPIYVTLMSAITNAEKSIDITVAYFLPDPQLLGALTEAAQRGVAVRLVLPSQSDFWAVFHAGRSRYADLLRAGVKIHERRASILHAKTVVVDDVWSTVGSTNLDPRSFLHNDEVNAVVLGYDFAREMKAMFENDVSESDAITAEAWRRRPLGNRAREWAARLWEYWM